MASTLKYATIFAIAGLGALAYVSHYKSEVENPNQPLVTCDNNDGTCRPKGLHSTDRLERDATVILYAKAGKCDKMQGNAHLACMNISPN